MVRTYIAAVLSVALTAFYLALVLASESVAQTFAWAYALGILTFLALANAQR